MAQYNQDQLDLVDRVAEEMIGAVTQQMQELAIKAEIKLEQLVVLMNRVVFPKHGVQWQIIRAPGALKAKDSDDEKVQPLRKCMRDGCNNPVATKLNKLCQQHRDEKVQPEIKLMRKCQRPGCQNPVPTARSKLCLEHKNPVKEEKPLQKCARADCEQPVATARSKYCVNHKRSSPPKKPEVIDESNNE